MLITVVSVWDWKHNMVENRVICELQNFCLLLGLSQCQGDLTLLVLMRKFILVVSQRILALFSTACLLHSSHQCIACTMAADRPRQATRLAFQQVIQAGSLYTSVRGLPVFITWSCFQISHFQLISQVILSWERGGLCACKSISLIKPLAACSQDPQFTICTWLNNLVTY